MITLIEIFDQKQYENIIAPVSLENISKVIYIGTREIMTNTKINSIKSFFIRKNVNFSIEFLYVERDNSQSIDNRLIRIINNEKNCVFDATGGEDMILTKVGIFAERYNIPILRIDAKNKNCVVVHGKFETVIKKPLFTVSDFLTLHGAEILRYEDISDYTNDNKEIIKMLFTINAFDCEAYSAFCNIFTDYITEDKRHILLNVDDFNEKCSRSRYALRNILQLFEKKGLLICEQSDNEAIKYRFSSDIVYKCLAKSGQVLEYYVALGTKSLQNTYEDIKVGVCIDWNSNNTTSDTQNEIDVMAVSDGFPVFISCKNGEVKKEALYELDSVARKLGGCYAKKVLVCTYLSKSRAARDHIKKRAKDMGIKLVFDSHKKTYSDFCRYLSPSE